MPSPRFFLRRRGWALALSAILLPGAWAQSVVHPSTGTSARPQDGPTLRGGLSPPEKRFLEQAAMGDLAEIELGTLAQQKSAHGAVKRYGESMAADHGNHMQQLKQLAVAKGVALPLQPSPKQQNDLRMLQTLSGPKFDREYLSHIVRDHERNIARFDQVASQGKDVDLRAFAAATLPTLRKHLEEAQQVRDLTQADLQSRARPSSVTP